jgi:hypothetical protein
MPGPSPAGSRKRAHFGIAEQERDLSLSEIAAGQQLLRLILQNVNVLQQLAKTCLRFAQTPLKGALRYAGARSRKRASASSRHVSTKKHDVGVHRSSATSSSNSRSERRST